MSLAPCEEFLVRLSLVGKVNYTTQLRLAHWCMHTQKVPDAAAIAACLAQPQSWARQLLSQCFASATTAKLQQNLAFGNVITILSAKYPRLLLESYAPPVVLYYVGNWQLTKSLAVAVVGSRSHSQHAEKIIETLIAPLAQRNVTIVSGLAAGIDQLAHRCALTHQGHTIAVIGTGLDQTYPRLHRKLQAKIAAEHLLISEYPLQTPPRRHHFPRRNRILANLAAALVVVEAKQRSGSLITANIALENNRPVLAVPGMIINHFAEGTNQLIQAGAKPVLTYHDILQELVPYRALVGGK